jgi:hypothetical protein
MAVPNSEVWIVDDSSSQSETEQEDGTTAVIKYSVRCQRESGDEMLRLPADEGEQPHKSGTEECQSEGKMGERSSNPEDEHPAMPTDPEPTSNAEVTAPEVHIEPQDVNTIMANERVEVSHTQVIVGLEVADNTTEMGRPKDVPISDKPTLDEEQAKDDGADNGAANSKVQQSSGILTSNEQEIGGGGAVASGPEIKNGERILEQVDDEKRQIRNSNSTNVVVPMKKLSPNELRSHVLGHLENVKPTRKYAIHEIWVDAPNPHLLIQGLGSIGFPLSEHDINKIKAANVQQVTTEHQTPNSSLPSSRKVWEIPGNLWIANNPSWNGYLNDILSIVNQELSINDKRGLLSKQSSMVLYEAGSVIELSQR